MPLRFRSRAIAIMSVLVLVPAFQNCGKGFVATKATEISSQCQAQMKSPFKADRASLKCAEITQYRCEVREFSPLVEDGVSVGHECAADRCVEVTRRRFSTAAARLTDAFSKEFRPGGEYNRNEFSCHHALLHAGTAVIEGEGETMDEALARAESACERAGS